MNGPKEDFAAFVEWVLVNNGLLFTVCPAEEDFTSPTTDPGPSQPSRHYTEHLPEPTTDGEPEATTTQKPEIITEPSIEPRSLI